MGYYYMVDRARLLAEGQVLDLVRHKDINPDFLQEHVEAMFPSGVSRHGDQYFLSNAAQARVASPAIEILFEYVRRAHFPDSPSRYQSWFGTKTVEEARLFGTRFAPNSRAIIWRVESDTAMRADMNLLTAADSTLVQSWRAHRYWQGDSGPDDPFWEYLLQGPVTVRELVEESAHESSESSR